MENVITMINNAVNVFQFQTDLLPLQYSNYCLSMEYTCINIMCVITMKQLNKMTDVSYQMTLGGAFVYVCENLEKRSH